MQTTIRDLIHVGRQTLATVIFVGLAQGLTLAQAASPAAQAGPPPKPAGSTPPAPAGVGQPVVAPSGPPPGYLIGPDDLITIKVWQDDKMSGDVVVRPDGKVTLALINDIQAAGLTPDQFRLAVMAAAGKFVQEPTVDVYIKQINSRKIFITGEVAKPNEYPLSGRMTVMQAIAKAGGLTEYANKSKVTILRTENGNTVVLKVNYSDILSGKNVKQNYELRAGDVVNVSD
jgi:polysaccharide biosynthesis/export protein